MSKKLACLLLSVLFLFAGTVSAAAMDPDSAARESGAGTRWSYTNYTATSIRIASGGTATCSSLIQGYPGTTTKVTIEMTLQKRFLLLFWTDEQTWKQTFTGEYGSLVKNCSVSSGTYRVSTTYTAYSGNNYEVITMASQTTTY